MPCVGYARSAIARAFDEQEIEAFEWVKENTPEDAIVLATLDEGHLVNAIAQRRNVVDNNFLMQPTADQRLDAVKTIYTTRFETEAIRVLNKYSVDYIFFSEQAKREYSVEELNYVSDDKCFRLVYNNSVQIYKSLCEIEEEV